MTERMTINTSTFARDFESTLGALDAALTDATRAVSAIRAYVPQIAALAEAVVTIETAVTQARQNLDADVAPAWTPAPSLAAPAPPVTTPAATLRAVEPARQVEATPEPEEARATGSASQCLRLQVVKTGGPLDLKAVDNAMNEHPEIIDLALLDYDGQQATLKVWVAGPIDRALLQQSLTNDLLERIGEGAGVRIEFDQESAAA